MAIWPGRRLTSKSRHGIILVVKSEVPGGLRPGGKAGHMSTIHAVHINDRDTCVTVTGAVRAGDTVEYRLADGTLETVTARHDAPIYHKIAVADVSAGGYVYKYGEKIGIAASDIKAGDYVHTHNLKPVGHQG